MLFTPPPFMSTQGLLMRTINSLGLTANLRLAIDCADANSYSSGQIVYDLSGRGNHFRLGATTGVEASDPTFNGTSGGDSSGEYFSFDGGDYLIEDGTITDFDAFHKDNGVFTIIGAFYLTGTTNTFLSTGNNAGSGDQGIIFDTTNAPAEVQVRARHATASAMNSDMTVDVADEAWNFVAVSVNEATGANGCTLQVNATQESYTSTYTTPSASDPAAVVTIGARNGGTGGLFSSGSRFGCIAAWATRLSDANLTSLYTALGSRYGF